MPRRRSATRSARRAAKGIVEHEQFEIDCSDGYEFREFNYDNRFVDTISYYNQLAAVSPGPDLYYYNAYLANDTACL
jgi:hypothetical protein